MKKSLTLLIVTLCLNAAAFAAKGPEKPSFTQTPQQPTPKENTVGFSNGFFSFFDFFLFKSPVQADSSKVKLTVPANVKDDTRKKS